jgi:hypothetical protein
MTKAIHCVPYAPETVCAVDEQVPLFEELLTLFFGVSLDQVAVVYGYDVGQGLVHELYADDSDEFILTEGVDPFTGRMKDIVDSLEWKWTGSCTIGLGPSYRIAGVANGEITLGVYVRKDSLERLGRYSGVEIVETGNADDEEKGGDNA